MNAHGEDTQNWPIAQFNMGNTLDWASLVLIRVMKGCEHVGYVFVIDRKFGDGAKYKMPGGHGQRGETPHHTAMREALGEAGVLPSEMRFIDKWEEGRGDRKHWKCLFACEITESRSMELNSKNEENEGEEPEYFTVAEFERLVRDGKFLPGHYREMVYCKLITEIEGAKAA